MAGQVSKFLRDHLGHTIPSPAIMERIGTAFRPSVSAFAADEHVPVVHFGKDDRKIDVMRRYLAAQAASGRSGVAAIGVAQEFQNVFAASKRQDGTAVWFSFYKADRRVTCFYFYLWDEQFGPAFIKVCSYFPYTSGGRASELAMRLGFENSWAQLVRVGAKWDAVHNAAQYLRETGTLQGELIFAYPTAIATQFLDPSAAMAGLDEVRRLPPALRLRATVDKGWLHPLSTQWHPLRG